MKPLLFLHGWGTTANIWKIQCEYFSSTYPVFAPNYFIEDPAPCFFKGPFTIDTLTQGLFDYISYHHLSPVHLIGWSLGSMPALAFTSRFPSMVSSMTLASGTPKFLFDETFPWGMHPGELRLLKRRLKKDKESALKDFYQLLFSEEEKRRNLPKRANDLLTMNQINDQALLEGLDILESIDLRSTLSDVKVPTLLLHGAEDQICSVEASRFMHRHIPQSLLEIFPLCGHLPFFTQEHTFNQVLKKFLNSLP